MLGRSWVMILMVMMERDTAAADYTIVSKFSGESVELLSSRTIGTNRDFRWTHLHLLLNNRTTKCYHSRCELMEDGSLRFSKVLAEDSGNYTLEVYDQHGTIIGKKVFFLQVKDTSPTVRSISIICSVILFLLLFFVTFFILGERWLPWSRISGSQEETHIYMVMHGNHGNNNKQEEEKRVEEPL